MNEEAILELHNELSADYEVGDIDQFKAYLQDPESRVDFFEQIIKPVYAVEDIADFEAFYGLKKTIRNSDWEVVLRSLPPYLVISS